VNGVRNVLCLIASLLVACGSSHKPKPVAAHGVKSDDSHAKPVNAAKPAFSEYGLPARCDRPGWPCVPPRPWVAKLCEDVYPDVALHMFAPHTPWQRFYMLKNAEPVNASGGATLLGDKIHRGEEVIVLKRNTTTNGIDTSDIGGYDILRWNGACATVHDGEFVAKPLSTVGHAHLNWRELGLPMRQTLEADPGVGSVYEEKRRQCKGASIGRVTADCEDYDKRLVDEVVRYVRDGGKLAKPKKVP
jgi:hypothetical protein